MNDDKIDSLEKSLVELSNGMRGVRTGVKIRLQKTHDKEPIIEFIASDETVDRAGEIINAKGWLLDNYKANPVFQNSHQYGDIIFTIGRTEEIETRTDLRGNNYLYQRVRFAVEENPFAKVAYELYRGGFLNAVSVGFKPIKWIEGEKAAPARRVFIEQELIEVSAVSIPANQNALAIAAKNGRLNVRFLDECVERLISIIAACKRDQRQIEKKIYRIPINQSGEFLNEPDSVRLCALFKTLKGAVEKLNVKKGR